MKAAGSDSNTTSASTCIAPAQPKDSISMPAIGAIRNWPKELPVFTTPKAMPRLSGTIKRVAEGISTAGPAMPAPPAASTPTATISPSVLVM
jgi:hypothetical protein